MDKPTLLQKGLVIVLYGVITLSVVLSIFALKNVGQEGFDKCMAKQCEKGVEHCSKFRTINNCCTGAGGNTNYAGTGYTCIFPS